MRNSVGKLALLALVIGGVSAPLATAEGEFSANAALTTDYVWRGVSQADEGPALQLGLDYANGPFYIGTWASNVDFGAGSDANIELDIYAGFSGELSPGLTYDVGYIHYIYPGTDGEDLDFGEVYAGLGYEADSGFGVGAYVYQDFDNESTYLEGTASYGFTEAFAADVSLGNYSFDGGDDYTNWSVGGTYTYEGFDFDLRYWDTDIEDQVGASVPGTEERVVLSVSKTFVLGG